MNETIRIRCFPRVWDDSIGLFIASNGYDDRNQPTRSIATDIVFTTVSVPTGENQEPLIRLDREEAQALINSLWECGLRPSQGRQSEGVTAAQGRHLEDMRALAFAKLGIAKP